MNVKKKFSLAVSLAIILALTFVSLASAAQGDVLFTTDAPCPVTVQVLSYTNSANQSGQTISGSTPWTLPTFPSTGVTFFYPASVTCSNGITYNFVSVSPGNPVTSGASTVTVVGHYALPVPDVTPPVWVVPANFSVEATSAAGAVVSYTAFATDPDDAVTSQSCSPASGATFALGTTTVNCTATDTHNNSGTASFTVTVVDTISPTLTLPANITVPATGPSGATVNFAASANDAVDGPVPITCLPASGSLFAIGVTTVNCSATDLHGNTNTGGFTVTVLDNAGPILTLPADITVAALDASGATVNFSASANDVVDGSVPITCLPASGSLFAIGVTSVNCSASDLHGNTSTGGFTVTVLDNAGLVLTLPADITVPATDASGKIVSFIASANDQIDGPVPVTCAPVSGSLFPIGITTVNCLATNSRGNISAGSFIVTVLDNVGPVLTLPADITVPATDASGAIVSFTAFANDQIDGPVPVTCSPASGSLFAIGATTINCSATNSQGIIANGSFSITVQKPTGSDDDEFDDDESDDHDSGDHNNKCGNGSDHEVLQPINADGSSTFNAGSTVPVKFCTCNEADNADSVKNEDVIKDFRLIKIIHKDHTESKVDEDVSSNTPHTEFRSGNNRQWIFNVRTKSLDAGNTYVYLITLKDGSTVQFQFDLK